MKIQRENHDDGSLHYMYLIWFWSWSWEDVIGRIGRDGERVRVLIISSAPKIERERERERVIYMVMVIVNNNNENGEDIWRELKEDDSYEKNKKQLEWIEVWGVVMEQS